MVNLKWDKRGQTHIDERMQMDSSHRKGQTSEYMAACWFSDQGWEVFWSNLGQSSVDFLVVHDNEVKSVQVKSAISTFTKNGSERLRVNLRAGRRKPRRYKAATFDLLVVCAKDGRIWVIPEKYIPKVTQFTLIGTDSKGFNKWLVRNPQI